MSLLPTIQRSKTQGELRRRLLVRAVKAHTMSGSLGKEGRKAQAKGLRHNRWNPNAIRRKHQSLISQANTILNPPRK